MKLSKLLNKIKKSDSVEKYMFVSTDYDDAMFTDELSSFDVNYEQELQADRFDNTYIITLNNKNYFLVKRIGDKEL